MNPPDKIYLSVDPKEEDWRYAMWTESPNSVDKQECYIRKDAYKAIKGSMHKDGCCCINLYYNIPEDMFPELIQGADEATPVEILIRKIK